MKIRDILTEHGPEIGDRFQLELGNVLVETGVIGIAKDGVILESDDKTLALLKSYGVTFESTSVSLTEGMSDVDLIFQELANGIRDISSIMINPQTAEERYVADKLQDMFYDVIEDFNLDPKKDAEKIISAMGDRLYDEYASDEDADFDIDQFEPDDDAEYARDTGENWDDPRNLHEAEYQGRKVQLGKPMAGDVKKSKVYVRGPKGNVVKVNFGDKKMKIKKSNPKRRKSFRARHNCDNPGPRHKARYWSCRAW